MTPGVEIEPGPQWWKASALTTRPALPPDYHSMCTGLNWAALEYMHHC